MLIAKVVQGQGQKGVNTIRIQRLELPNPPLLADTDLPPAHEQPPTPPEPSHQFSEPEDTTGQADRRNITGVGARSSPRVLCGVVASASSTPSIPATIPAMSLPVAMESSSFTAPPVCNFITILNVMACITCM